MRKKWMGPGFEPELALVGVITGHEVEVDVRGRVGGNARGLVQDQPCGDRPHLLAFLRLQKV